MDIPSAVQRETGTILPARVSPAWLVRHGDQPAVLRRLDRHRRPVNDDDACDDVVWLQAYLAQLTGTTFPAPEPLPFATGRS